MAHRVIVRADWDEVAKVWVASSDDVPGLVTEADSLDALVPKLQAMIPELLDANGYPDGDDLVFDVNAKVESVPVQQAA